MLKNVQILSDIRVQKQILLEAYQNSDTWQPIQESSNSCETVADKQQIQVQIGNIFTYYIQKKLRMWCSKQYSQFSECIENEHAN